MIIKIRNTIAEKIYDVEITDQSIQACWARYYIEVFLVSFEKLIEVFGCALLLSSFWETLTTYLLFGLIRSYAKGWHALQSWYCSVQSIFFLSVLPAIFKHILLPTSLKEVVSVLALIIILRYAPQATDKSPIVNDSLRMQLKIKSFFALLFLLVIQWFAPSMMATSAFIAITIQLLMVLPITKKFFEGRNNDND